MGYVPDWQRQSHAKGTGASKPTQSNSIKSVELFHNAPSRNVQAKRFADGGEVDLPELREPTEADRGDSSPTSVADLPELREPTAADSKPAAPQKFGEAFKSAKDGSTFEWNGKLYKKEYAQSSKPQAMSQEQVEKNDELWKKGTARGSIYTTPKLSSEVEKAQSSGRATPPTVKRGGGMLSNQSGKEVKGAEPSNWSTPTSDTRTKEEKIKAAKGGKYVQGRTPE